MALHTAFTELFSLRHPIALAPMGAASGGALAAAVSNGGGLGLVGGGRQDPGWLDHELEIVAARAGQPWGVGFQSWATDVGTVERALAHRPRAVMLSFGDCRPFVAPIRGAGAALIVQVTDLEEARQALDAGADVIVAQGTEAGGHGGRRSTLPFVPAVADLAAPTPVLAVAGSPTAGGWRPRWPWEQRELCSGPGSSSPLKPWSPRRSLRAIIEGSGDDTDRSRVSDIARGAPWPPTYPARTLRNPFFDLWRGREDELAADSAARQAYQEAVARGDLPPGPVWASEAIDLITEVCPAADLVGALAAQAEEALLRAGNQ